MARLKLLDRTAETRIGPPDLRTVPQWLLIPGLVALAASCGLYVRYVHFHPIHANDLAGYRAAAEAFLAHRPLYTTPFFGLWFTSPPAMAVLILPATLTDTATAALWFACFGVGAIFLSLFLAIRMVGYRGVAGRIGLAAAGTALAIWTEPVQTTFLDGQVNTVILLLIVADLAQPDRSRFKGIGVGAATAVKLVPGLFVVYLLLTRRLRAAVTAAAAFLVLTALLFAVRPRDSIAYWLHGGLNSHKVLIDPRYNGEQALQGTVARLLNTSTENTPLWILAAVVVGIGGMALATWLYRRGYDLLGLVAVGYTSVLVSPSSWSHYWIWVIPMTIGLADIAARATGTARTVAAGVASLAVVPFLAWPLDRPRVGPMGPIGVTWSVRWKSPVLQALATDSYAITAVGLFLVAAVWLYRTRPRTVPPSGSPPLVPPQRSGAPAAAPAGNDDVPSADGQALPIR